MRDYLIKRLLLIVVTLFLVSIIVFVMVRLIPGDIVDGIMAEMMARSHGGEHWADRDSIERFFGVDVPIHIQYGHWLGVLLTPDPYTGESSFKGLLQGSLGDSLRNPESTEGGRRVSVLKRQEGVPVNLG